MIKEKVINNPKLLGVGVPYGVKEVSQFQISNWDQNLIYFLELRPIPFLGLDLIDPQSSFK